MARGDPTYAHVDVTWPNDPRSRALSPAENWLYEVCVLAAVEVRRNCLPPAYGMSNLCSRAAVRRSTMISLIRKATKLDPLQPIIFVNGDGRICLPNIGKRHPKLDWKEAREGPTYSPNGADTGPVSAPPPSLPPSSVVLRTTEGASPPVRRGQKLSESPSTVHQFLAFWSEEFKRQTGAECPRLNFAKDGKLVKEMLEQYDLGRLKALVVKLWKSDDPFIKGASKTIGLFKSQLPKLLSAGVGGVDPYASPAEVVKACEDAGCFDTDAEGKPLERR